MYEDCLRHEIVCRKVGKKPRHDGHPNITVRFCLKRDMEALFVELDSLMYFEGYNRFGEDYAFGQGTLHARFMEANEWAIDSVAQAKEKKVRTSAALLVVRCESVQFVRAMKEWQHRRDEQSRGRETRTRRADGDVRSAS